MDLRPWLHTLTRPGQAGSCTAYVRMPANQRVAARLCAVRKSEEAIVATERMLRRRAQRNGQQLNSDTLESAPL